MLCLEVTDLALEQRDARSLHPIPQDYFTNRITRLFAELSAKS
jgi:hypothetical protein